MHTLANGTSPYRPYKEVHPSGVVPCCNTSAALIKYGGIEVNSNKVFMMFQIEKQPFIVINKYSQSVIITDDPCKHIWPLCHPVIVEWFIYSPMISNTILFSTTVSCRRSTVLCFTLEAMRTSRSPQDGASNFHVLVYFQNDFGTNLESFISLNHTNQAAKPTDLTMIFLTFQRRLVFPFDILYFECAHKRIRGKKVL